MTQKSGSKAGKMAAVGAGIAAISAATYLLLGKDGKRNQKNLRGWMLKMKGEVLEKIENMQEVSSETFENIVNDVSSKYKSLSHVDAKDLEKEVKALHKNWKELAKKHGQKKTVKKTKLAKK